MKKIIYKSICLLVLISTLSCADYLDLVPEKDIETIETVFERRNTALEFYNGLSNAMMGLEGSMNHDPALCGGDELVSNEYPRENIGSNGYAYIPAFSLATGHQQTLKPLYSLWGGCSEINSDFTNMYMNVRNANIFIEHIDKVYDMEDEEKELWKAEAKCMKAFYYFLLFRQYGPIILFNKNIDIDEDITAMQLPRSHVDTCVNEMIRLLEEAIPFLISIKEMSNSRIQAFNREAAYFLRAKILLYAASPLFNGNEWYANFKNRDGKPLFSAEYDNQKWERAAKAIDEAVEICENSGIKLIEGYGQKNTELLNIIRDIQNSVLAVEFKSDECVYSVNVSSNITLSYVRLPIFESRHFMYRPDVYGCVTPSMRMIEVFYTNNGLPIDMDRTWSYSDRYKMGKEMDSYYNNVVELKTDVLNLHLRREPRFYANIGFDKGYWEIGKNKYFKMDPYRKGINGLVSDRREPMQPQNITGYWCKKRLDPDGSFEPGTNLNNPLKNYILFRFADLYLMQAEAWNEFSGPSDKVYDALNKIRLRAGIPTVQEAWTKYSKQPNKYKNKEGLREIIRQERTIEMCFESSRFWDLRRWKTAHIEMNKPIKGWNVFGENSRSFYNNYNGPIEVWTDNKFLSPRDYFWPISSEEVMKGNVVQNLGW